MTENGWSGAEKEWDRLLDYGPGYGDLHSMAMELDGETFPAAKTLKQELGEITHDKGRALQGADRSAVRECLLALEAREKDWRGRYAELLGDLCREGGRSGEPQYGEAQLW